MKPGPARRAGAAGPGQARHEELLVFGWLKRRRRAAIRARPLPPAWQEIIERNVPYAARLPPADRAEHAGLVQVFLAEKRFEGCGGLEITEEIRVTIAAQACVLLLHRETDVYPQLTSIVVYPSAYRVPGGRHMEGGLIDQQPQARLGESWAAGIVVLAWDSVLSGTTDVRDGRNLVLHEFAHQLDQEDGSGDGAPILPHRSMFTAWARVLGREFDELVSGAEERHRTLLDHYGATSPAEFFAVATETFFERPRKMLERHPELYDQLREFYRQDPAALAS